MPSFPQTNGLDPPSGRKDLYGTDIPSIAGMNVLAGGTNIGGQTARARPNEPSLRVDPGAKPPNPLGNPSPGATQPTQKAPIPGATGTGAGSSGESEFQNVGDSVGNFVVQQFQRMKNDRTQTDALLLRCLYAAKGEYTPDELSAMGADTPAAQLTMAQTYFPIVGTKIRAGCAWIADIFAGTEGRLWSLSPSSIPNVPDFIKEMAIAQIKKEIMQNGGQVDEQTLRSRIKELRDIAMAYVKNAAQQATDRMANKIQDQLEDTEFDAVLSEFVTDVLTFPYAVLKGPVARNKKRLEWQGANPVVKTVPVLMVERVSPFDYYFTQYQTSPQHGNLIELMHMSRASLYLCRDLPNFDKNKIEQVLESYPTGYKIYTQITVQRQQLERNTMMNVNANELIDTFDFWGEIPGRDLKSWGMPDTLEDEAMYEVNAWVINGICVRCMMNPDPLGARPYYVTSYEKVPGALVGRCIPVLIRSNAEIINSAWRALRRNMGLASGPFTEVDISRLEGQQAPNEIRPAMVKAVSPDITGANTPAYRFHDINSHAQELQATIDTEIKRCDDVTGIPAYSYGNAAVAGAGRTVGGLAMLMGNASKGIKKVIANIENDVLNPLVEKFYVHNMVFDEDAAIKVDAQVVARGPTGVILKEAQVQRRVEALQVIGPYIPTGIIPKDGVAYLLRQVLQGLDLDVDKIIPSPEMVAQLQALQQAQGQGQPPQPGAPQGPPGAQPPNAQGPGLPPNAGGGSGGPPQMPGMPPQLPGGNAPRVVPPTGVQGTVPQVLPDRRSGPAGGIAAALNAGRM